MVDMEKIFYKILYLNLCLEIFIRDLLWKFDEKNKMILMFLFGYFYVICINS